MAHLNENMEIFKSLNLKVPRYSKIEKFPRSNIREFEYMKIDKFQN